MHLVCHDSAAAGKFIQHFAGSEENGSAVGRTFAEAKRLPAFRIDEQVEWPVGDTSPSLCGTIFVLSFAPPHRSDREFEQLFGSVGEYLAPGVGDDHIIFDSHSPPALNIDAGLHRNHVACGEWALHPLGQ